MHGLTIASRLISEAKQRGNVQSITVEVGELAPITSAELQKTIEQLCKWKIKVVKVQATVKCACGYTGKPKITERLHDIVLFECPRCRAIPSIVEGDAIKLKEVVLQ